MNDWDDNIPIYLQLRSAVIKRILSGSLAEGDAVPSVRTVASSEQINPLTVSKAYQMLVEENLLEKRRGLGMFVQVDARQRALEQERQVFLRDEWPRIASRIESLGLDVNQLMKGAS